MKKSKALGAAINDGIGDEKNKEIKNNNASMRYGFSYDVEWVRSMMVGFIGLSESLVKEIIDEEIEHLRKSFIFKEFVLKNKNFDDSVFRLYLYIRKMLEIRFYEERVGVMLINNIAIVLLKELLREHKKRNIDEEILKDIVAERYNMLYTKQPELATAISEYLWFEEYCGD